MNDLRRGRRLIGRFIDRYELDLQGLTVLTEAASGPYLLNHLLAAMAGAHVLAVTRDSSFAAAESVQQESDRAARELGVTVEVAVGSKPSEWLVAADIVTNSGWLRPITDEDVMRMKQTAVIPLMWEPWEFRPDELALASCREHGIVVLGTNESEPPCDMRPYGLFLALKLLFELELEGAGLSVLLLGDQPSLGIPIAEGLRRNGIHVGWFGSGGHAPQSYEDLADRTPAGLGSFDAILVAEHADPRLLIGKGGIIGTDALAEAPGLRVGIISGSVDRKALEDADLCFHPDHLAPFGYMSYQTYELGPAPVLDLYAAGLRVGERLARHRLAGASPEEAARRALREAPAADFEGDLAWT